MRENLGEIDVGAAHFLPRVVAKKDIRGVVHMHTTGSDGHNSIREMADAALACGFKYIAITDHSKTPCDDGRVGTKSALEQIKQVRAVDEQMEWRRSACSPASRSGHSGRWRAGSWMMKYLRSWIVVIASVHSRFEQSREEMTEQEC